MAEGGEGESLSLQDTPTWALATVFFVFISVSLVIEHLIDLLSSFLKRHRKIALFEAVEKLKSVLILLGFMSLILTVTQRPIAKICVSTEVAGHWLPCRRSIDLKTTAADNTSAGFCESKGKTSLITQVGANQLNNFIFVLAVTQVVYSGLTMALGRAQMRRWKAWETETQTIEYLASNDPNRFRFTRQTTFGRRHMTCSDTPIQLWIKCFFRQFFSSVAKVDYLTMRHGFISAHLSNAKSYFNFQKYIQKSLEEDFKRVVGIRPVMWLLVVIFLLLDVHGWQIYLWVSFVPLIIVLVLGTKLQVIVATMAIELKNQQTVIKGAPLVQPNDKHFWFSHPKYVLTLIHFVLFMNSFEIAFFVWVTLQYGIHSCYHEHLDIIITRVTIAVIVQVLCSYSTLPLYALVTQMGSQYKSAMLEDNTVHAVKQWHAGVKEKRKKVLRDKLQAPRDSYGKSSTTTTIEDISSHHRSAEFADDTITPAVQEMVALDEIRLDSGR